MNNMLNTLKRQKGLKKPAKKLGRGYGSNKGGHTSTKGNKGQKARSGGKIPTWYEGGQTSFAKRMPYQRGFTNHAALNIFNINFTELSEVLEKETKVNVETLVRYKLIKNDCDAVKILSNGIINKKVEFDGFIYSRKAKEKIIAVGGLAK
jgi:large subunit ribosomal protein L15